MYEIAKKGTTWHYDKTNKKWTKTPLPEKTQEYVKKIGDNLFKTFMIKITMTALLNRNVDKNYILNILAQSAQEPEEEPKETLIKQPKEILKNEENEQK